ncbi:hypothetical protein [Hyphomonas chukchiensis]|uniref:DUF883 family protein n=1 Tax=Hyphomonas chukchiensis TaxID=1280947 RepID=UPI0030FC21BE|tara:strand:- start:262 stop:567 length:306 start_codon:yes stop_codon:yes gene_type:complete
MDTKTATGTKIKSEIDSDVDALKSDIAALRDDLRQVVKDMRGLASVKAQAGVDKGTELAKEAGEQIGEAKSAMETRIRENPLGAIGIAFGAGVILAMMRRN